MVGITFAYAGHDGLKAWTNIEPTVVNYVGPMSKITSKWAKNVANKMLTLNQQMTAILDYPNLQAVDFKKVVIFLKS